jgi:hypothetical protein
MEDFAGTPVDGKGGASEPNRTGAVPDRFD